MHADVCGSMKCIDVVALNNGDVVHRILAHHMPYFHVYFHALQLYTWMFFAYFSSASKPFQVLILVFWGPNFFT